MKISTWIKLYRIAGIMCGAVSIYGITTSDAVVAASGYLAATFLLIWSVEMENEIDDKSRRWP